MDKNLMEVFNVNRRKRNFFDSTPIKRKKKLAFLAPLQYKFLISSFKREDISLRFLNYGLNNFPIW